MLLGHKLMYTLRSLVVMLTLSWGTGWAGEPVKICDDAAGWPPYSYHPVVDGTPDATKLEGATIELVAEIFNLIGLDYSIDLLPWKRCLTEVAEYDEKKGYEVFINGSYNEKRAEKYYLTTPIYYTRRGVFYSEKKFPDKPPISGTDDLKNFKICGVAGNNYSKYRLSDSDIHSSPKSLEKALKMLAAGRCDIVPSSIEVAYGHALTGHSIVPSGVEALHLSDLPGSNFHIFVSKTSPRSFELLAKINQAIIILQNNGESERLFEKYMQRMRKMSDQVAPE